jgi:hypothetical protein
MGRVDEFSVCTLSVSFRSASFNNLAISEQHYMYLGNGAIVGDGKEACHDRGRVRNAFRRFSSSKLVLLNRFINRLRERPMFNSAFYLHVSK